MDSTHFVSHPNQRINHADRPMTKKEFYTFRDYAYNQIRSLYGNDVLSKIQGNPFSKFSHSAIKDSPFRSYNKEYNGLIEMFNKYFPGFNPSFSSKSFSTISGVRAAKAVAAAAGAVVGAGLLKKKPDSNVSKTLPTTVKPLTAKKIVADLGGTAIGQKIKDIGDKLPENVKDAIKNEGEKYLQRLQGDLTAPETLPKTLPQKELERTFTQRERAFGSSNMTLSMNSPLVIAGIVLILVAVLISITKR